MAYNESWDDRADHWLVSLIHKLDEGAVTKSVERLAGVWLGSVRQVWVAVFLTLCGLALFLYPLLFESGQSASYVSIGFFLLAIGLWSLGNALADLFERAWVSFAAVTMAVSSLAAGAYIATSAVQFMSIVAAILGCIALVAASITGLILTRKWSVGVALVLVSLTIVSYSLARITGLHNAWSTITVLVGISALIMICWLGYEYSRDVVEGRAFSLRAEPRTPSAALIERVAIATGITEIVVGAVGIVTHVIHSG